MDFRAMIQQIVREQLPVMVLPATVLSVNKAEAIIDAQPLERDAPELFDVRLRAVDDDTATGLIAWPVVGSVVLIGLIGNDINTAFVVAASEVESFTISSAQESLLTVLQDLIAEIKAMRFTTNQGPTIQLLNSPAFDALAQRLPNLLTA
jgi:hypothetical protein